MIADALLAEPKRRAIEAVLLLLVSEGKMSVALAGIERVSWQRSPAPFTVYPLTVVL